MILYICEVIFLMNYILVLTADVLLALGFVLQKIYQKHDGSSNVSGLFFTMCVGFFSAVIFFVISGFNISITPFSALTALLQTIFVTLYTLLSFKVLKSGDFALYMLFLMTGGMVLPYIFGVLFLNEELTLLRSIGLILIIIAVILSNTGIKKPSKLNIILCILIFCLNGGTSIVSKLHQVESVFKTIDSESFVFLTSAFKCLLSIPIFLVLKKKSNKNYKPNLKKVLPIIAVSSLFSGISYMLQLIGAATLPATVVYPLITGGSIILSSVVGLLVLKEKPSREQIAGTVICFIGTGLFL